MSFKEKTVHQSNNNLKFSNFILESKDLYEDKYPIININGDFVIKKNIEETLLDYIHELVENVLKNHKVIVVYAYLENYKNKNIRIFFLQKMLTIFQRDFPDILYKCFIVDAPPYFNIIYRVVSMMIDKETRSKIHFQNCKFDPSNLGNDQCILEDAA